MKYSSHLQKLYAINLGNPVKLGLENTLQLYKLLGKPTSTIPIIHVAGTNGKGSVCLKISEVLRQSGYKTGLFTSPHISTFRERIQVNANLISEEDFISTLSDILPLCEKHNIPATFFEISTIMGLLHFERMKCDAIVLEVGLGGRLDSTNIVSPKVSVITSIQMDHVSMLGNSLEEIARAKAGIMKAGVSALVGPQCPIDVMKDESRLSKSLLYELDHILSPSERRYKSSIDGTDSLNADLAHAAIKLLRQSDPIFNQIPAVALESGLKSRPPCRFEIFKYKRKMKSEIDMKSRHNPLPGECEIDVIFDIAHNMDAVAALMKKMITHYPSNEFRVVLGMSADKDISEVLSEILKVVPTHRIHCTEARSNRAMSTGELRALITSLTKGKDLVPCEDTWLGDNEDVETAVHNAVTSVPSRGGVVIVCGTTFIMASARAAIGIMEPRDSDILSETINSSPQAKSNFDAQENFNKLQ